jgi:hypothetical protein
MRPIKPESSLPYSLHLLKLARTGCAELSLICETRERIFVNEISASLGGFDQFSECAEKPLRTVLRLTMRQPAKMSAPSR